MLRSQSQVLALRSTFNLGVDTFDASVDSPDPNGKFFAWQVQIQFIRRL
ncbi:MAG: ShlB/FhaC/HecB family hemolysin secretion/activation protein, partial [Deltaproteobacteria bacterium]|nr:ShlB/FhaC/HecB family hemolysin secretion/activation protein [Deltaproteobacteria bacterium]